VKNVKMVIDRLMKINPNVEIVLAPIVKISSVHDVGSDWFCELAWSIECPAILGSLVTDEQRLLAQLKIDGINYSLQELAVLYPQVRFNMELGQMDVTQEFLSAADCFHPSAMGQQKISDLTFGY
jgi:hypothetical protein